MQYLSRISQKILIGLLAFTILVTTSLSCNKEIDAPIKQLDEEVTTQIHQKVWWVPVLIVAAVVVVVIKCTEGQYSETTTVNSDGSYTIHKDCLKVLGHCAIHAFGIQEDGKQIPTSSIEYFEQPDLVGEGMLAQDKDGHIIYVMENTPENLESFNKFFYDDVISISRPWVIDNEELLTKLLKTSSDKIVVQGDYKVQTYQEKDRIIKYIILR